MKIPTATYRLQFSPSFTFANAKTVIAYLRQLGISDIYASPVFKARKGSTHGYDITDHGRINPELGTPEDFLELTRIGKTHGLGWIQDIVPNHMAFCGENALLCDILEHGRCSPYFHFFDIEWDHAYETIRGRVLAPFLGTVYGAALENGEITLSYDDGTVYASYYDVRLPLAIETWHAIFYGNPGAPAAGAFDDVMERLKNEADTPDDGRASHARRTELKQYIALLYNAGGEVKNFVDTSLRNMNGARGVAESFNRLDELLSRQRFKLSFWKVASEELNYRRFFTINDIVSLNVEDERVFRHVHALAVELIKKGAITGLRVDHIDGLYDPAGYLGRLRNIAGDIYITVEKILAPGEKLPNSWPVQGTTGYDFLNAANGLFCRRKNKVRFEKLYAKFAGVNIPYHVIVSDKRRLIIGKYMAGDVDELARLMKSISSRDRYGSDITLYGLKRALVELLAFFPVYRTYVNNDNYSGQDRAFLKECIKRAKEANPIYLNELEFIEKFLMLDFNSYLGEDEKRQWVKFVMRFQQYTGPLMAKGFEDTVLYVYNRLLSLNEVGGNPETFGVTRKEFDAFCAERAVSHSGAMNSSATHDTKRGEDARARLNVLSELPHEWARRIRAWRRINAPKKRKINGMAVPSANDEYFLYQSLLAHFPFHDRHYRNFLERLKNYIIKSVREAKVYTAWLKPDTDYENAFLAFIDDITQPSPANTFLYSFLPFQKKVSYYGMLNSLSQTLLKMTAPGLPDFYQGTELWDISFVDPDNRGNVDFKKREMYLNEILAAQHFNNRVLINRLLASMENGCIKLFLIARVLGIRKENRDLFHAGRYVPLDVKGPRALNIIAHARVLDNRWAITVAPRFLTSISKEGRLPTGKITWGKTYLTLPPGAPAILEETITQRALNAAGRLYICDILRNFPVALLFGENTSTPPHLYPLPDGERKQQTNPLPDGERKQQANPLPCGERAG